MTGSPFRFVTELTWCNDEGAEAQWRPTEAGLGSPDGARPATIPGTLVLEALGQCAGLCLQTTDSAPGTTYWMLTGIDDADVDHIGWDREVTLTCTVHKRGTRAAVMIVSAATAHGEVCHATILMHRIAAPPSV